MPWIGSDGRFQSDSAGTSRSAVKKSELAIKHEYHHEEQKPTLEVISMLFANMTLNFVSPFRSLVITSEYGTEYLLAVVGETFMSS